MDRGGKRPRIGSENKKGTSGGKALEVRQMLQTALDQKEDQYRVSPDKGIPTQPQL